jgi:hypothetical protein
VVSMTFRRMFDAPGDICTVDAEGLNRRRQPEASSNHGVPSGSVARSIRPAGTVRSCAPGLYGSAGPDVALPSDCIPVGIDPQMFPSACDRQSAGA